LFSLNIFSSIIPGDDIGDLEYIEGKVIAGDYFQVSGDIDALNDTIEYVPATGKIAFLIEAKITMKTNPAAVSTSTSNTTVSIIDQVVADLLINSVKKSKAKIGVAANTSHASFSSSGGGDGSGMGGGGFCKFNVLGLSLVGDSAKKIEIKNVLDNGSAFAEISGYLV